MFGGFGLPIIGSLLGGLAGGIFGKSPKVPAFQMPTLQDIFKGPLGTATRTGFTYKGPAELEPGIKAARLQLSKLLQGGLQVDPQRLKQYQQAWYNARAPFLQRQQQQQRQRLNNALAARGVGLGTATSRTLRDMNESQNMQNMQLLNQSITGAEHLADVALNQKLRQLGALAGISQQDIANRLAAFGQTMNALQGQQAMGLKLNQMINDLIAARTAAENSARFAPMANIISGMMTGFNLGMAPKWLSSMGSGGSSAGAPVQAPSLSLSTGLDDYPGAPVTNPVENILGGGPLGFNLGLVGVRP